MAQLVDLKVVGRIMDYLRDDSSGHAGLLVMLLANVTTSDRGCLRLLQLDSSTLAGFNVYVHLTHVESLLPLPALTLFRAFQESPSAELTSVSAETSVTWETGK